MSTPLFVASILSIVAAGLHSGLGETALFRGAIATALPPFRLPRALAFLGLPTPTESTDLEWRYLRTAWHLLSVDFTFSAIIFAVAARTPSPELWLIVHVTAARYAAYELGWLLSVALHHRNVLRAPQWLLLTAIAGCAWLG